MVENTRDLFAEFNDTHEMLNTLTAGHKEALADLAMVKTFTDKQEIATLGEPVDGVYFLLEGSIRLEVFSEDGDRFVIGDLQSGDIFGLLSVMDQQPSIHYAASVGDTRTIFVSGSRFRNFIQADPELSKMLVKIMCQRLRMSLIMVNRFAPGNQTARVVRCLVALADGVGLQPGQKDMAEVKINQFDLAAMLSVSRQSVNKVLKDLETNGLIKVGYNSIAVHDLPRLREMQ